MGTQHDEHQKNVGGVTVVCPVQHELFFSSDLRTEVSENLIQIGIGTDELTSKEETPTSLAEHRVSCVRWKQD